MRATGNTGRASSISRAIAHKPFIGRQARRVVELALQCTETHRGMFGERTQCVLQRGVLTYPLRSSPMAHDDVAWRQIPANG